MYNLAKDGDTVEQNAYREFLAKEFPSYEKFWQKSVVPLTNRPQNIHFMNDAGLSAINKTHKDICIAQLNYSILLHLVRCYEINHQIAIGLQHLTEGMVRLVGAQDIAFELLERISNPIYQAWSEDDGTKARREWQKKKHYPLQPIRDYRNRLVHGRLLPAILNTSPYLPRIGKEDAYLDWRMVTDPQNNFSINRTDLALIESILDDAWNQTIQYIEGEWRNL